MLCLEGFCFGIKFAILSWDFIIVLDSGLWFFTRFMTLNLADVSTSEEYGIFDDWITSGFFSNFAYEDVENYFNSILEVY